MTFGLVHSNYTLPEWLSLHTVANNVHTSLWQAYLSLAQ